MKKILAFAIIINCFAITNLYAATGLKVIDGDSLMINGENIRLKGIDAPEFLQKCYDPQGWKYRCGYEALKKLKQLTQGRVTCKRFGTDRYKRTLGVCYGAKGVNINREMVRSGWAVAYGDEYYKEENEAKSRKSGIWKGKFMRPELFRALKRRLNAN